MDEGCACMKFENDENIMGFAGSGILYPAKNWQERIQRVAELLYQKGITNITSHDGCGAAGIAYKRDGEKEGTGFDSSDEYGKKWSQDLTETLQKLYKTNNRPEEIDHSHIAGKDMVRPESFHSARVVYFDATGNFNPGRVENIPKGFLIDYGNEVSLAKTEEEKEYPIEELKIALNIAFGSHGFGDKFNSDNPFIIVVEAKTQKELDEIKKQIEPVVYSYGEKVKIDGFIKE